MRTDLFVDKKCIHIKISKEVHSSLRMKLFKHNITMQELFNEFARLVVTDTAKSESIIKFIVRKRLEAFLNATTEKKQIKVSQMGDLDNETLYSLINDSEDDI